MVFAWWANYPKIESSKLCIPFLLNWKSNPNRSSLHAVVHIEFPKFSQNLKDYYLLLNGSMLHLTGQNSSLILYLWAYLKRWSCINSGKNVFEGKVSRFLRFFPKNAKFFKQFTGYIERKLHH